MQVSRGIVEKLRNTERSLNKQSEAKRKMSLVQSQNKKRECESHKNDRRFSIKSKQRLKRPINNKIAKILSQKSKKKSQILN